MKWEKGKLRACVEYGKRAKQLEVSIFGPLCITEDGEVYHVKTGLRAGPPPGVTVVDPKAYLSFLLDNTDPYIWQELERLEWGKKPPRYLIESLLDVAQRYRDARPKKPGVTTTARKAESGRDDHRKNAVPDTKLLGATKPRPATISAEMVHGRRSGARR